MIREIKELKRRTWAGFGWTSASAAFAGVTNAAVWLAMARWLNVRDFAAIAVLGTATGIGRLVADFGIPIAIVQRGTLEKEDLNTLFWINLGLAAFIAAVIASASGFVARFIEQPALADLIPLAGLVVLVTGATPVFASLLQRQLAFGILERLNMARVISAGAATSVFVYGGWGPRGWLLGQLFGITVFATGLGVSAMRRGHWIPGFACSAKGVRPYYRFGSLVLGKSLVTYVGANADVFLVGKLLGPHALGLYHFARRLITQPRDMLGQVVSKVAYPVYTESLRLDNWNTSHFRRAYLRFTSTLAAVGVPAIGILVILPAGVFLKLFGQEWAGAVTAIRILALSGMVELLSAGFASSALYALNRPGTALVIDLALLPIRLALLLIAAQYSIEAVAVAVGGFLLLKMIVLQDVVNRAASMKGADYLKAVVPALSVTGIGVAIAIAVSQVTRISAASVAIYLVIAGVGSALLHGPSLKSLLGDLRAADFDDSRGLSFESVALPSEGYRSALGSLGRFRVALFLRQISLGGIARRVGGVRGRISQGNRYRFRFFKLPTDRIEQSVTLDVEVAGQGGMLVVNGFRNAPIPVSRGRHEVRIDAGQLDSEENVLAHTEGVRPIRVRISDKRVTHATTEPRVSPSRSPETAAAEFICRAVIGNGSSSPFADSTYCLYDYDGASFRLPGWLWSSAPPVSALLGLASRDHADADRYRRVALAIGESLLRHQQRDGPLQGALMSRLRHAPDSATSFDTLLAPNDSSFAVRWALIPLWEATGDRRFLEAGEMAMRWVSRCLDELDDLPAHYRLGEARWENHSFIDVGFVPEGFAALAGASPRTASACRRDIERFEKRFLDRFRLPSGFFGQNLYRGREASRFLFTRGQAWVLEGLIAAHEAGAAPDSGGEVKQLADKLLSAQLEVGAWPFALGHGYPSRRVAKLSGNCEKATAVLAFLLLRLDRLFPDDRYVRAAVSALTWCENQMSDQPDAGHGGIRSRSFGSGIVGLPYVEVATTYANAFYVLGKLALADRKREMGEAHRAFDAPSHAAVNRSAFT